MICQIHFGIPYHKAFLSHNIASNHYLHELHGRFNQTSFSPVEGVEEMLYFACYYAMMLDERHNK